MTGSVVTSGNRTGEVPAVRSGSSPVKARGSGEGLFVELRRVLRRLEHLGIVAVEDVGALGVAVEPDLLIAVVRRHRAPRARDRRQQVLVEALLQVHDVAG